MQAEDDCASSDPYDRDDYAYPQRREQDIQDEIGAAAGGWYGMYEARIFASGAETDIEHIVAAAEAHRSGLCGRTAEEKTAFANDLNNLTLASPDLNRNEKSDKDAAEWLPPNARCWFARTVVFVKQAHDLTVDEPERAELERVARRVRIRPGARPGRRVDHHDRYGGHRSSPRTDLSQLRFDAGGRLEPGRQPERRHVSRCLERRRDSHLQSEHGARPRQRRARLRVIRRLVRRGEAAGATPAISSTQGVRAEPARRRRHAVSA